MIGTTTHDRHGSFPGVLDNTPKDNGGNTPTIALPPGSVAINSGNPLTADQRDLLPPVLKN